ncbi:hypothetical protein D5F01_LYC03040 [Larimichthys crocea]|uniref:Uncharacterized protein n=1 Tax=Larimichthys crocea TaxID=215358 RepID=A0A6G0J468_LARCR|nr:hypothetical protein D5F01_LYC03040 [Larimichthys crocea]
MSHQSSPAEVKVICYYTVKLEELDSPSPLSDTSSITIHSRDADATTPETPAKQTSGLTVSTPHVTTPETPAKQTSVDQTLHESNTKASLSPVTPPNPAPGIVKNESSMIPTKSTFAMNTGSGKLNRQRPHNDDSDIYHVYATIPEEPSPSALNMVYSTVQAH